MSRARQPAKAIHSGVVKRTGDADAPDGSVSVSVAKASTAVATATLQHPAGAWLAGIHAARKA
jgi:hypothetical protein